VVSDTQILAVHGLRIESVGGEVLVDGVDLQLADGDRLGLLGMSGSGKSLTALALIDLLPPGVRRVAGSIKLGGQEVTGFDDAAWCQLRGRRIGFIFQDPSTAFNPVLRIGDFLDPTTFLDIFHSASANNRTGWNDPDYDRLLERIADCESTSERTVLCQQAETLLLEAAPLLPLFHYSSRELVSERIKGFHRNLLGGIDWAALSLEGEE